MPLTEKGFERLTYDDILTVQIERAKLLFGEDIDTSDQSIFGKILRLYCLDAAENQELAEDVYLSAFPKTARGVNLDRVCSLVGISRNSATHAQHKVTITGTAGTTVEMGFFVAAGDVVFHTVDSYIIGDTGTVDAIVECNEAGTIGNVGDKAITEIVNPVPNVSKITQSKIQSIGREAETDYELRNKFSKSLSTSGSGTFNSIESAILRVDGVEMVTVVENTGVSSDSGAPSIPHSFQCYVLANDKNSTKQAIAEAIFSKKPIGIHSVGAYACTVYDISGNPHTVKFSYTQTVIISVKCTIVTNSSYSNSSLQEIKNNIINKLSTYRNSQSVTATSLYGAVYVNGVEDVTSLEIKKSTDTEYGQKVSIDISEVARATNSSIEVIIASE